MYGNVANECGMLIRKQLEARQAVRQPAYIFGGTAHQAVCFADEPPMEAATWRLNKAEHYKLRRRGFEKRQPARSSPGFNPGVKKITDKKSGRRNCGRVLPRFLGRLRRRSGILRHKAIAYEVAALFKLRHVSAEIGLSNGRNPIAVPLRSSARTSRRSRRPPAVRAIFCGLRFQTVQRPSKG